MAGRICVTRHLKQARGGPPRAAARPGPPRARAVFRGSVYLASITFQTPGGPRAVAAADLGVVREYVALAAPTIAAYASQYGPAGLVLGAGTPALTVQVGAQGYRDADLQGWVDQIVRTSALPPEASVLVLNPTGVVNEDAKESGGVGVLGYHGKASVPYSFVNLLGTGMAVGDPDDLFAEAVSHELAEMTVDPAADGSEPEVCDGCGTNCQGRGAFRAYFDAGGRYLDAGSAFPPGFPYRYFISAIARPAAATDCPAPAPACVYPPPGGPTA